MSGIKPVAYPCHAWQHLLFKLRFLEAQLISNLCVVSCAFLPSAGSKRSSRGTRLSTTPAVRPRTLSKLPRLVLCRPRTLLANVFCAYVGATPVTLDLSAWQPGEYRAERRSVLTHYSCRCCEFIRAAAERGRWGGFIIFGVLSSRPNFLRRIKHQLGRITSRCN